MLMHETNEEYAERLRRFVKANPTATADDLALLPKAKPAAEVWARFNASARANGRPGRGKPTA